MTDACIGWEGDEPCAYYGQYHGCVRHRGTGWAVVHVCTCNAECTEAQARSRKPPRKKDAA